MRSLTGHTVVVAGATGNVGPFLVRALLDRGATVAVPSRSEQRLRDLRGRLSRDGEAAGLDRLHPFVGDLRDPDAAARLKARITEQAGPADAVVASVGEFVTTTSVLDATADQLTRALDGSVLAHLAVARTFLPGLAASGGTFMLLQGPLAFEPRPELGSHLVSIATAGQHMLFRALAQEFDHSPARVVELVIYSLIRGGATQPGSPVTGIEVGAFAAHLVASSDPTLHGKSIHLRAPTQLTETEEQP